MLQKIYYSYCKLKLKKVNAPPPNPTFVDKLLFDVVFNESVSNKIIVISENDIIFLNSLKEKSLFDFKDIKNKNVILNPNF